MSLVEEQDAPILIVTPDYLPNSRGLTSFTVLLENSLKRLGLAYEIFHWRSLSDLKKVQNKKYQSIFHTLYLSAHLLRNLQSSHIVFCHQNEKDQILKKYFNFTSKLQKPFVFRSLKKVERIVFGSAYSHESFFKNDLERDYYRDWVFNPVVENPNPLGLKEKNDQYKSLKDPIIKFYCPHGISKDVENFLSTFAQASKKQVLLYASGSYEKSGPFSFHSLDDADILDCFEFLKKSHFTLAFEEKFLIAQDLTKSILAGTPVISKRADMFFGQVIPNVTGWSIFLTNKSFSHFAKNIDGEQYKKLRNSLIDYQGHLNREEHLDKLLSTIVSKNLKRSSKEVL